MNGTGVGNSVPGAGVPDYALLRPIGRGAYGEVWLARSKATGTLRAAKIVWRHRFEDERPFQREFEGIQRFERLSREHPSQLALFHIGRNDAEGYFYYVMELADNAGTTPDTRGSKCEGAQGRAASWVDKGPVQPSPFSPLHDSTAYAPRTLRAELTPGRLPAQKVVEIGLVLTEALGHLHRHGLVHRDVKPSNVIFVNGRPKLADIGLVTDASDSRSIVGTEGYLAPEGPGTPSADIFALGKVLYEAATGRDRRDFPRLPDDLRSWRDAKLVFELNEVVVKACASNPDQRYRNCEEMHAEIKLLSNGRSVKATRTRAAHLASLKSAAGWVLGAGILLMVATYQFRARQPIPLPSRPPDNPEAKQFYQHGLLWYGETTGADLRQAIACFERAVIADTNSAAGYAALGSTWCWTIPDFRPDLVKARWYAEKALSLNRSLAEPHKVLGWVKFWGDQDASGAEKEFLEALARQPDDAPTHEWYAVVLGAMGRQQESLRQLELAHSLNPGSLSIRELLGAAYLMAGQEERGLKELKLVMDLEPHRPSHARRMLGSFYENRGDIPKALELFERCDQLAGTNSVEISRQYAALREAFARGGMKGFQQERLKQAAASHDFFQAVAYSVRLHDLDQAFVWLDAAITTGDLGEIARINYDARFRELRSDPRYAQFLERLQKRQAARSSDGG